LNISKDGKQRVLLVDDEERIVNFLALKLKVSGYEVVCAGNGEKALELAQTTDPDIMLLDIIMPGIDGFEVLRQVRGFSKMPIITFSASASNYPEAIKLGANDFITKPFQPDEMVKRIRTLLKAA